jgi:2-C-methyl-D-erythritol 2,4-cyclodiphosphate synthase
MRVGIGYDVHALVEGRKLILGGVEIPFEHGLAGHSDGDVLVHAIMDALLGAAALGDIGTHFPATDSKYKDISSLILLAQVDEKLRSEGWQVVNIDTTVAAEQPRLSPFVRQMQDAIGQALQIQSDLVSVKATTTEGLGFTGRGEGIAAIAVALVQKAE